MVKKVGKTRDDIIFDIVNYTVCTIALLCVLYPLYFIIISSLSKPSFVTSGMVWFFPKGFTLIAYEKAFNESRIWLGYRNTTFYAAFGTMINLFVTLTAAYAMSRKDFMIRKGLMLFFSFTMFFGGGLIPSYLLIKNLGMYNTIWSMLIPGALSVYNMIVARTYLQTTIPDELLDSAVIDGCSDLQFFISIVLPLSKAIVAVIGLYYAVGHWNAYFNALIYLKNRKLMPLQIFLRDLIIMNEAVDSGYLGQGGENLGDIIKNAVIIVSVLPMMILYPFLQKYFIKGVMIGSIKG